MGRIGMLGLCSLGSPYCIVLFSIVKSIIIKI